MAADCKRGCGVRSLEESLAFIRRIGRRRAANRGRIRFRAGNHERLFLSGDRPAAASDGRNNSSFSDQSRWQH